MATTSLDDLIEQTRVKANVLRSNFVLDPEIVVYLNEARKQFRELVVTADDSYYQSTLDFSVSAQPLNLQALPSTFWKMRGLDAFAGDSLRQREVFAREFRNRFDADVGYFFGGDGNSIVVCGQSPEQCNPFRLYYTPKPLPFAQRLPGETRSIAPDALDGTNAGSHFILTNANFRAGDVGGSLTVTGFSGATDGTYTILSIVSPTEVVTIPAPPPSESGSPGETAVVVASSAATRTFAVAPTDSQNSGLWTLQNGNFGLSDVNSYLTIDVGGTTYDGTFQIGTVYNSTAVIVTPAITGASGSLTGTASLSRQPPGTDSYLDLTEDNFSEYFSVRAAMVIARKKRQDSLVAQLGAERAAIEDRIAALSRMRQSEPQQAPVLWGRRSNNYEDWEV